MNSLSVSIWILLCYLAYSSAIQNNHNISICFHSNQALDRETEVALYDYAHFTEEIYGYRAIIIFPNQVIQDATDFPSRSSLFKFIARFKDNVRYYNSSSILTAGRSSLIELAISVPCKMFYAIKHGTKSSSPDSLPSIIDNQIPYVVHSTSYYEPHGYRYAVISNSIDGVRNARSEISIVPLMVVPPGQSPLYYSSGDIQVSKKAENNLRSSLGIPSSSLVLCQHGEGIQLQNSILAALQSTNDSQLHFLFLNTTTFHVKYLDGDKPDILSRIHYLPPLLDLADKEMYLNNCDGIIYSSLSRDELGLTLAEFIIRSKIVLLYEPTNSDSRVRNTFDFIELANNSNLKFQDEESLLQLVLQVASNVSLTTIKSSTNSTYIQNIFSAHEPIQVMSVFHDVFIKPCLNLNSRLDNSSIDVKIDLSDSNINKKVSIVFIQEFSDCATPTNSSQPLNQKSCKKTIELLKHICRKTEEGVIFTCAAIFMLFDQDRGSSTNISIVAVIKSAVNFDYWIEMKPFSSNIDNMRFNLIRLLCNGRTPPGEYFGKSGYCDKLDSSIEMIFSSDIVVANDHENLELVMSLNPLHTPLLIQSSSLLDLSSVSAELKIEFFLTRLAQHKLGLARSQKLVINIALDDSKSNSIFRGLANNPIYNIVAKQHYGRVYILPHNELCNGISLSANTLAMIRILRSSLYRRGYVTSEQPSSYKANKKNKNSPIKLLCLTYTIESNHRSINGILNTWGRKCDGYLAFSNASDKSNNIFHFYNHVESYNNIWTKVVYIWNLVASTNLIDEYNYFLIGGDDLFVIVENLREYLASLEDSRDGDNQKIWYLGRPLYHNRISQFNAGGSGYLLNRHSLKLLIYLLNTPPYAELCMIGIKTSMEDLMVARCLALAGIYPTDTALSESDDAKDAKDNGSSSRDQLTDNYLSINRSGKKEIFHVLSLSDTYEGSADWYNDILNYSQSVSTSQFGKRHPLSFNHSFSEKSVSFQSIKTDNEMKCIYNQLYSSAFRGK